jgi:hypothetical protein
MKNFILKYINRYNEVYNKYKNGEILPQTANEHIQEIKEMLDV